MATKKKASAKPATKKLPAIRKKMTKSEIVAAIVD